MGVIRSWRNEDDRLVMVVGTCGHTIEDYAVALADGTVWCPSCDRKVDVDREIRFTLPGGEPL